jgi:hypothetical protein
VIVVAQPVSQGLRTPPTGSPPAAAARVFRGNGFTIQIPATWVDLTLYTLLGNAGTGPPPYVRVSAERGTEAATAQEFGDGRIRQAAAALPGGRLLKRADVKLGSGQPAHSAEIRWYPSDEMRLYQRMLFVVWQGTGLMLVTQLDKKSKATIGPTIDRLMASLRPADPRSPAPPPAKGLLRFTADPFTLDHPEGWEDRTVYTVAEPDEARFRRNLVVHRRPMPEEPTSIQETAAAEADALKGSIPGIEIVEIAEARVKDGKPAARVLLRRDVEGGTITQTQVIAHRSGVLNVLTFTCEEEPQPSVTKTGAAILESFSETR